MQRNVTGQRWIVFAFEDEGGTNPGEPVTGDAANITANLRIDGGAANAVDDTNPAELEDGFYYFDITQAESNGDLILIAPASSTANVNVIGCPPAIYTTPANFPELGIAADGDISGNVDGNVVGSVASVTGAVGSVTGDVTLDMADTLPGSPTAGTVGDALVQSTREEAPKRAQALSDIAVYLVQSSDHNTPFTGTSGLAVTRSLDGGSFGAVDGGTTITEVGNGLYMIDAAAADMTADVVVFRVTATGADPQLINISTVD